MGSMKHPNCSLAEKIMPARYIALALVLLLTLVSACAGPPRPLIPAQSALEEVPPSQWPVLFDDLDAASFFEACRHSLAYLERAPADRRYTFGPYQVSAADLAQGIARLRDILVRYPDPLERTRALQQEFVLLRSVGSDGQGSVLFTAYYEPVLPARRRPAPPYVHPLYALPSDWVTVDLSSFSDELPKRKLIGQVREHQVVPYPDREAIDFAQAIKGKATPLAYVDDPVEAFFLHIQGSGQVRFADGSRLRLGFAGANGQPYRSIGRMMIKEGLLESHQASMQGIKQYIASHPEKRRRILAHNPSYVFFRPLSVAGGPLGCFQAPLTAGRSIATDRRVFPGLAVAWINGAMPAPGGGETPYARFVLNQDTGGAIRGPGRVDLFMGTGDAAGQVAGRMKNQGQLYFLAPRPR